MGLRRESNPRGVWGFIGSLLSTDFDSLTLILKEAGGWGVPSADLAYTGGSLKNGFTEGGSKAPSPAPLLWTSHPVSSLRPSSRGGPSAILIPAAVWLLAASLIGRGISISLPRSPVAGL